MVAKSIHKTVNMYSQLDNAMQFKLHIFVKEKL